MKDSGVAWIGKVPDDWNIIKLKYCASFIQEPFEMSSAEEKSKYVGLENVHSWDGQFVSSSSEYDIAQSLRYKRNDILFGKLRPYLAKVYCCEDDGCCSSEFCVIRVNPSNSVRYFWNLLISPEFVYQVDRTTYGAKMPRANASDIKNIYVPVPPLDTQISISTFLDKKCVPIDEMIAAHRTVIERLKEYKQSLITEVVTKGLNPYIRTKDSGVEWIGSVPEHWSINRIGNLYRNVSEPGNDSLPILSVSINSGVSDKELSEDESERMFVRSEDRSKYKRVRPGDLTYNMMRAWQGAFGAVRVDGMVSPAYIVARPKAKGIDTRYIEALMRTSSATEEMHRYSHGIADFRLRLYWPEFKNIKICLPDLSEQQQIADYIDMKSAEIDSSITIRESLIAKLTEYKKSLIYEVVTGKKEV